MSTQSTSRVLAEDSKSSPGQQLPATKNVVLQGLVSVVGRKSISVMSRFRVGNVPVCLFVYNEGFKS